MADVPPIRPYKLLAAAAKSAPEFGKNQATLVLRNATAARAILRVVALAARAQIDGSVQYEDNKPERWQPAVDAACDRLQAVRDVLIDSRSAPGLDWFTSLALVEALGAALWCHHTASSVDSLDELEFETAAQVAIDTLDSLLADCEACGVFEIAHSTKAAGLH